MLNKCTSIKGRQNQDNWFGFKMSMHPSDFNESGFSVEQATFKRKVVFKQAVTADSIRVSALCGVSQAGLVTMDCQLSVV